jgi:hypothetical protein
MPSLSQRLGSFPTELRADNFSQCRKDFSLALPINRGGFDDLKEEKIGFKVSQKTSLPSFLSPLQIFFFCFFFFLPPLQETNATIISSSSSALSNQHRQAATKQPP